MGIIKRKKSGKVIDGSKLNADGFIMTKKILESSKIPFKDIKSVPPTNTSN